MENIQSRILASFKKGFINQNIEIDEEVRTRFLTNDLSKNISVLETIKNELNS